MQLSKILVDIEHYCDKNNIIFKHELFSFRTSDSYSGIVSGRTDSPDSSYIHP